MKPLTLSLAVIFGLVSSVLIAFILIFKFVTPEKGLNNPSLGKISNQSKLISSEALNQGNISMNVLGFPSQKIVFSVNHNDNPGAAQLQSSQLSICESRQDSINAIMNRIYIRSQNQLAFFSQVLSNIKNFNSRDKLAITNYDELVSSTQLAQSLANKDLGTMKEFDYMDCIGTAPLTLISNFELATQQEANALQSYKIALTNLVSKFVQTSVGR